MLELVNGLCVDLHCLAGNLASAAGPGGVADACRDIQRLIDRQDGRSPLIAEGHVGTRLGPARALSICFPTHRGAPAQYRELGFARQTDWASLVETVPEAGQ
jgi:hypothetical protein